MEHGCIGVTGRRRNIPGTEGTDRQIDFALKCIAGGDRFTDFGNAEKVDPSLNYFNDGNGTIEGLIRI